MDWYFTSSCKKKKKDKEFDSKQDIVDELKI